MTAFDPDRTGPLADPPYEPPTARHRAGPYGDPPTDPAKVGDWLADNDLLTSMARRRLVVRRRWTWPRRRPAAEPLVLRDPETTLRWFTDHVTAAVRDQLVDEGLVPARAQTMHGRLAEAGPLPWFVGGLATALLVVVVLALTVWQVA